MIDRSIQPVIHPLQEFVLQAPVRDVMPNGTRLTVMDGGTSDVFRLDIMIHGGQWRQTMPLQATFTNRMLSEGTQSLTSAQISDLLDRYGAWMCQNTSINFSVITLFSLNKYAQETLDVVEKILREPIFPQKEFQVMVDNARQQFQVNSQKVDNQARKKLNQVLLGDAHPCARYAQLDDYALIQTADLQEFYNRHYHSGNLSVYLSGKVTPKIEKMVVERLGRRTWGMDSALVPLIPIPPVTAADSHFFIEDAASQQSAVQMGMLTIPLTHPDFNELRVVETAFGGYFGSRLMSNIREEKGYTYGIGSGIVLYPFETELVIATQCAHEYVKPLIQEVYHEMVRLQEETISEEELAMVKNYMLGELTRQVENVLSLSDVYIYAESSHLKDDYMTDCTLAVRRITPDRVQELARKYFVPQQMKEVVVGKNV